MKDDVVKALLDKVISSIEGIDEDDTQSYIKYFQALARYKYDNYQQYSAGLRFIETLAIWLEQFGSDDKKNALDFIKNRIVYVSSSEINLIAESCFVDKLQYILMEITAEKLQVPKFKLKFIEDSKEYEILRRQSLFCGLSDGARLDIFRRANTGILSHEQIYLTYELSEQRILKMKEQLVEDLNTKFQLNLDESSEDSKFKSLFLIDDFSASGTSYLKLSSESGELKGKIAGLYQDLFSGNGDSKIESAFDKANLKIYIILYICSTQAKDTIEGNFDKLYEVYKHRPELIIMHELDEQYKIKNEEEIFNICMNDEYYDKDLIEDKHTQKNIKLGFSDCALPLILEHNTPNNSVPILWTYEYSEIFKGLFPRIPRHRVL
ncbi:MULTISPECIES: hypothetical protein [unclassified Arcicella]|uniref:phosphoribosyltransferase-like protein n=1 Tax=unclassified Arcicella TaxID=2644986 RepID=UPI002861A12E|nr:MULTISPECIES: hypothetical protein [unclassified Arcicella]MDR6564091.1 hypothetical protein [Arcicella sp. BE51]MDR6813844.1 hypothetical protein [Arcicella sp. BE140]MDR6825156.1 hypothetical protein [Arcicella sp. BE139]